MKPAAVRVPRPRVGRRRRRRCSPSTATRPRCSPVGRASCRCWRCASPGSSTSSTSTGSPSSAGIERQNGTLTIRAMTAQARVEHDDDRRPPRRRCSPRRLPLIGHFQIRNRGTVGGSIAHADPAVRAARGRARPRRRARGRRHGGQPRRIPARRLLRRARGPPRSSADELLTAVALPGVGPVAAASRSRSSPAAAATSRITGVVVARRARRRRRGRAVPAIGLFGMAPTPVRADAGRGRRSIGTAPDAADLDEIGRLAVADIDAEPTTCHASADVPDAASAPHLVAARARPSAGGAREWLSTPIAADGQRRAAPRTSSSRARRSPTSCARTARSPARTSAASTACAARARCCVDGDAVRSCLMFAVQADGADVTTIEGLGPADGSLGPVQEAFRQAHGLQCGFCTPGFVVTVHAFLQRQPRTPRSTRSARACPATSAAAPATRGSSRPCRSRPSR